MKNAYRLFKRSNRPNYFIQDNRTGVQTSLGTADKDEAKRLLDAKNQTHQSTALNLELGKTFIAHANPEMATRTWQVAMDEMELRGGESSRKRYGRAMRAKEFDLIRNKAIIETTGEDLRAVLKRGGNATCNFLRRLHNLALDNGWIQWNILAPKQWEKSPKKPKRAITLDAHWACFGPEC